MHTAILPNKTIGILGGGQLGMMLAIKARQMGYKIAILEKDKDCPAFLYADYFIEGDYTNTESLDELINISDVITTEFENIPRQSLEYLEKSSKLKPSAKAIIVAQNRLLEKDFFNSIGLSTTRYYRIQVEEDCIKVLDDFFPCILKTSVLGYDGKGQIYVTSHKELLKAWHKLKNAECILEKIQIIDKEISVIVARNAKELVAYPVIENQHKNGILDISIFPSKVAKSIQMKAIRSAKLIAKVLNYQGVLAVEFFINRDGELLVNEMAPRPHNSGHLTIESFSVSQFEQQLRAICNLKLAKPLIRSHAIMINLLGDVFLNNIENKFLKILSEFNNLELHLYNKKLPNVTRKMGHIVVVGKNVNSLLLQINKIRHIIQN